MDRMPCGRCGSVLLLVLACSGCAGNASGNTSGSPRGAADATPLEVTRAFYAALHAGDVSSAAYLVASPNGARVAQSFVTMARAYQQLEDAIRDRFGADAAHAVGYRDRVEAENAAMRSARERVTGEDATVTADNHTVAALRRVEGRWRITLDEALTTEDGLTALAFEAAATRVAAERVVPAIRGGLFDSADDAIEAFRDEVAVSMQRLEPESQGRKDRPAGGSSI